MRAGRVLQRMGSDLRAWWGLLLIPIVIAGGVWWWSENRPIGNDERICDRVRQMAREARAGVLPEPIVKARVRDIWLDAQDSATSESMKSLTADMQTGMDLDDAELVKSSAQRVDSFCEALGH